MVNVLVTGGSGFIGSHVTLSLLSKGYNVTIVDNLSNGSLMSTGEVEALSRKKVSFYEEDICNTAILTTILRENKVDAVIHCAGLKSVKDSVLNPIEYYKNNVVGTVSLCEAMSTAGVHSLIFSSSATIYGDSAKSPITEEGGTGVTNNPYGTSKYVVERFLKELSPSNDKWKVISLRYFNPVGAHESGRIGEDLSGRPTNLVPVIGNVALGKEKKLSIFGSDYNTADGTAVRDYIHVCDLAEGHVCALRYLPKVTGFESFNLGTGQGFSVLEVVKMFESVTKVPIKYDFTERRYGDIEKSFASSTKAKALLGWAAERSLESMIEDFWRWAKNNPNGYNQ